MLIYYYYVVACLFVLVLVNWRYALLQTLTYYDSLLLSLIIITIMLWLCETLTLCSSVTPSSAVGVVGGRSLLLLLVRWCMDPLKPQVPLVFGSRVVDGGCGDGIVRGESTTQITSTPRARVS
jgi:hypothetical protein